MAEVDFYILSEDSDTARLKSTCTLIEQAFLNGERVLVWLENAAALSAFDNLLWTFGDRSFVPHEPLGTDPQPSRLQFSFTAVDTLPASGFRRRVHDRVPCCATHRTLTALRFPRVVEVVDAEPTRRSAGRDRFRFYREHGATPKHHELKARNG